MAGKNFKLVPSCYLFLVKDNKILMLHRYNTKFMDGYFSLIAGKLDGKETFREAMVREAKEEANIDVEAEDLEVVHVMHRNEFFGYEAKERVDIFFRPKKWNGEIRNVETDKHDKLDWFALDKLPENVIPYMQHAINCILNNIIYSEFGFK